MVYQFGDCKLDDRLYELQQAGEPCHVEPQVFNVLHFLLQNRDRVVPKEELLEAIWGDTFVSEATLNSRIMAARKAIGDDGNAQRYIKTVRGRGFRFVGDVHAGDEEGHAPVPARSQIELAPVPSSVALPGSLEPVVGRAEELGNLRRRLEQALAGRRQVVFVSGEAGQGKTTLVNTFLHEVAQGQLYTVLHGHCLDQRGAGEAYQPLLEALGRLCREPQHGEVVGLLHRYAPSWLAQMPWLVAADEWPLLERRVSGTSRERMLREMLEALDALSVQRPLLLILEDLHWSDYSTLDLLSSLARRQEANRLLVIATYRPGDLQANGHPLRSLTQELRIRGHSVEIALSTLSATAMLHYLQARCPGWEDAAAVAPLLHQRTGGNPLFMRLMVNDWLDRGWLVEDEQGWALQCDTQQLVDEVPETLRLLIERQIEQLPTEYMAVLETASVAGLEFEAAALAVEGFTAEETESRCSELARRDCFVVAAGSELWPGGVQTGRFAFTHHLYPEVLYNRIPPARRARLHREIGLCLEAGHTPQTAAVAPELAAHFRHGGEPIRAIYYSKQAAEQAMLRAATREAIAHLQQALDVIAQSPPSPELIDWEIELQSALASALGAVYGWMEPAAEAAYSRMLELAVQISDLEAKTSALYALATIYEIRGEYEKAQALLEECLALLQPRVSEAEPREEWAKPLLQSHELLACSFFHQGHFDEAVNQADRGLRYYNPHWYSAGLASAGEDAGVGCHAWASHALWFAGHPDQALQRMGIALQYAQSPGRGFCLASAMSHFATLHQLRGEVEKAAERARESLQYALEGDYTYRVATSSILLGWAVAAQGQVEEGIGKMRSGLDICRATGALFDYPYYLSLFAQVNAWAGRGDIGLAALDEAAGVMKGTRHFFYQPELFRMRGQILQQNQESRGDAIACCQSAIDSARKIHALSLELRATVDLCQLKLSLDDATAEKAALRQLLGKFNEGFDTRDLQLARQLLEIA